ncbi:multidrug resistance efflux pump [Anaerosolibacter carboniphilus]|uniref:Multidrug resistance efflux pump n=1 Tax=Anaerosolibacter carboniphilus TaxID=1417629 RepID=A0A841KVF0_9FIRM|nr:multidrug resistance efflux pump [Anaerosolibacter carboniphilus]
MRKIVPIVLAITLVLSGCSANAVKEVSADLNMTKVDKPVFLMAGKIDTTEKADITSKVSAKVSEIMVDIGSQVSKGDPLIKLDTRDLEAQVKQAEAGVSVAQANLDKLKKGARPEQKSQAEATLESAQKAYENAQNNYDRLNQLFQSGVASKQQIETAETQRIAAETQYKAAKEQLNMLNNGETKETIRVVEAQVDQAQAALEIAQAQLSNGMILSPITGTVSAKNINVGEMASMGTVLVSVVNEATVTVNAYLPPRLKDEVKVGQEVIVKVSEVPEKMYLGEITVIDPVIDAKSRSILVKVSIKDKDSALQPGMFAEIGLKK